MRSSHEVATDVAKDKTEALSQARDLEGLIGLVGNDHQERKKGEWRNNFLERWDENTMERAGHAGLHAMQE